ncbi:MAG: Na/Pi cotransporter family protein, partial [Spirochaetaceae bacterium]|nr:Na/Pi cotransporter family protein [Spirochaetaceae bacterium]
IDAVVSGVKEAACYTEYYRSRTNREFYKVWVLCQIPRKKAEQDVADFAKNISAPYSIRYKLSAYSPILLYMEYVGILFRIAGGLCLFLYGMKVMSDGIQQAAGDRLQRALNFMTKNRFIGVITGAVVTTIIQSSSATTVMVVSFVNAGLLTLTQSIGVIMGANIGTTTTAWVVSLIGFKIDISAIALPAVGIGFIMGAAKWKYRDLGIAFLGFGFIFLGLQFLTSALPTVDPESLAFIRRISDLGLVSVLIAVAVSTGVTLLMHSSAATITLIIALAFGNVIAFKMAAAMILGANIGTTIDAILAAIGTRIAARQTALVHVLFNVVGSLVALVFFRPLLFLVEVLVPGSADGPTIAAHLAMFHTVFNVFCTLAFLPFVSQFAALVSFLIKEKPGQEPQTRQPYKLEYSSGAIQNSPELNILRAQKEIRDMAGIASSMFAQASSALRSLKQAGNREAAVAALIKDLQEKEETADEMREELTQFLIECTRQRLSHQSDRKVSMLLRIIADLEDMTDDCYSVSLILERSVKKNLLFKEKEMEALAPYVGLVEEFLEFVGKQLGNRITLKQILYARDLEGRIDKSRNKLRKMGRKRIEAGENVKMELLFIDLVKRIEKLGDWCSNISEVLAKTG